jgi:predicted  nucleic acid-binding Zn-ribbon protein
MAEPAKLTHEQVLSLLKKMDTEEQTLRSLWDQFSVARHQAGEVITLYTEAKKEIPALTTARDQLLSEVDSLKKKLSEGRAKVDADVAERQTTMEKELESLNEELKKVRDFVMAAHGSLKDVEAKAATRKQEIEAEIQSLNTHRDQIRSNLTALSRHLSEV